MRYSGKPIAFREAESDSREWDLIGTATEGNPPHLKLGRRISPFSVVSLVLTAPVFSLSIACFPL